jgi:hypothetical protein
MDSSALYHHGIKGQKWGIRRYQNADGTLTEEGKKRYGSSSEEEKSAEKAAQRRAIKTKLRQAGMVALQTAAITAMLAQSVAILTDSRSDTGQSYVDTGKSYADLYLEKNKKRKMSSVKKEVDRSDWTWADYAWNEVEG